MANAIQNWLLMLTILTPAQAASPYAGTPPQNQSAEASEAFPEPRPVPSSPSQAVNKQVVQENGTVPIDLQAALRLAETANLDIAQARAVAAQAEARLQRAEVSILPNFNIGSAYNHHEGNIQKTEGNIIKANRDSLFVGGGPSLTFPLTDAIFLRLVARQQETATQARVQSITNETLLAVADAYLEVLRLRRRIARINEILDHLTTNRPAAVRGRSIGLLPLIRVFVERGAKEAFPADLERVRVEVLRRQEEYAAAIEDLNVASAELARLLRLNPTALLEPVEDFRFPLPLPADGWSYRTAEELITQALTNRPELAENQALVQAALERFRAAKYRPFLPNVVLNYNWGDFGGGPDLNSPIVVPPTTPGGSPKVINVPGFGPSGRIRHFAPRDDFDASLVWRLDNLGFGNRAEQREQEAVHRQAIFRQLQVQDQVIAQVVQAQDQVRGWRERTRVTRRALFGDGNTATGPVFRSMRLNFERIQGGEGRPLEVLDSIRGLSDVLEAYGQAITDYDRARFRLLIRLGLPPQALIEGQPSNQQGPPKPPLGANPG